MTQQNSTPQVILGAHFPGVNHSTVWSDPASGSHIDFSSFEQFAQTAERGCFDFLFLAEGLRLREQRGQIHDLDVVGRPDTLPVLAGIAAITKHLGLIGTINATYNEPYELARQFATLDHLSQGRAGWNVVTSSDAFTGENFRRGGYLDPEQRYVRAEETVNAARGFWDSWPEQNQDQSVLDYHSTQFDVTGTFNIPQSPQGHPIIFQAGDSSAGRDFAAANADAVFTRHGTPDQGRAYYADMQARVTAAGRAPDQLKVLPGATFVIGDTEAEAAELAEHIRSQQVSGQTALLLLEQIWNRDLSSYDPEGPLPEIDPKLGETTIIQGRARTVDDREATVANLRALAAEQNLNLRETAIASQARQSFVGTANSVADQMIEAVSTNVCDGFILIPHITPSGLDTFVDQVAPILQERGALRTAYPEHANLRELFGIPTPAAQKATAQ
jgi:FMN-dependent oxidoreductase (nitrilotriacetate monooxygenase family)